MRLFNVYFLIVILLEIFGELYYFALQIERPDSVNHINVNWVANKGTIYRGGETPNWWGDGNVSVYLALSQ
jgi:hypothetical protein